MEKIVVKILLYQRGIYMAVSYNKLWKLLIDKDMMKKDLAERAGISTASIAKLGRNENVNTDILLKICKKHLDKMNKMC